MMINLPLKIAVITALMIGAHEILPEVEGAVLPVFGPFTITEIEPSSDNGWSIISGKMDKNRNCSFQSMQFTVKGDGIEAVAGYRFLETTKVRPAEISSPFGPWEVQFEASDQRPVTLTAWHDCHWGYLTETSVDVQWAE